MHALQHCQCKVITAKIDATVPDLADLMDRHSVGCVVVVDDAEAPVGIVTDRDLVSRVVAAGRDAEKVTAGDVMSKNLLAVPAGERLAKVLGLMRQRGDGANRRQLHVLVDGRCANVQRTPENVRKAQYVVDLVRIIRPAGADHRIRFDLAGIFRRDLRIGIGQGEDQGPLGHAAEHLRRDQVAH